MAVDSSALTLSEWSVLSNDPVVQSVTMSLHKTMNVLKDIPLKTSRALSMQGVRFIGSEGAPSVNWATINEEPVTTKGKPSPYSENVYLVRNKFQIDNLLLDQPTQIMDPVTAQVNFWNEAFSYDFNDKFINNNPITGDSDCFAGIRHRLQNLSDFDLPSDAVVNAGALALTTSMTAAIANTFLEYVQNLLDNLGAPDGDGVTLYMNEQCKRRFEFAVRMLGAGGGFTTQRDGFDRPVEMYKGAKVRAVGRKVDQTTSIITSTETAAGTADTGGTATSIYAVRYGEGYVSGWQTGLLKPKYLGPSTENGVMHNIVIDWGIGLWMPNTRSIGRIRNIGMS